MEGVAQKYVGGLILIGMLTTALLPKRQTVPAVNAFTNLLRKPLATAMGTGKKV